jgi:uncharacterized protein
MKTIKLIQILVLTIIWASSSQAENNITIGTGGVKGVYYPTGGSICTLVNKSRQSHGLRCSAKTTDGSIYNLRTIRAGWMEFGIAQSDWNFHAYNGSSKFSFSGADKKLRSIFSVHAEPLTIIARKDSNIKHFDDLKGKRINIGMRGSGIRRTMEVLIEAKGWTTSTFSEVRELKSNRQIDALCNDKVDAIVFMVGHPSRSVREVTTECDAVLVNVSGPAVDRLISSNSYYRKAVIPGNMYLGSSHNTTTFGVGATFVSTIETSESTVYNVVKSVFENFEAFKRMHPAFKNLRKEEMIWDSLSAPLHPGALRYYSEIGLTPDTRRNQKTFAKKTTVNIGQKTRTKVLPKSSQSQSQSGIDNQPPRITITSHQVKSRGIGVGIKSKKTMITGYATDATGIVEVLINGKEAQLFEQGAFSKDIYLKMGQNKVVVRAMDINENWAEYSFFINRSQDVIAKNQPAPKQKSGLSGWYQNQKALIVGIDVYHSTGIPPLNNAVNDAKAIALILRGMGYEVTELYNEDATKKIIRRTFSKYQRAFKRDDSFLFYFAGHGQGIRLENGEQVGFIIPYDADLSLDEASIFDYEEEAIDLNILKRYSKNMKAKHIAMLLDSCFSGLAMKRSIAKPKNRSFEYYNDLLDRKSINILTAGDDQPVSDGSNHSPFARAIINALQRKALDIDDRDGFATFTELSVYVKGKVEKATDRRQRPQFDNLSEDDGDFIFKFQ